MGATRKYRNVLSHPNVALVVDDIASVDPWVVRGVEVRGPAEAQESQAPPGDGMSRQIIRVHPRRIISWGVDPNNPGMQARDLHTADTGGMA
jgi:pyridoxamine 5'-phosphate oxidase family protein